MWRHLTLHRRQRVEIGLEVDEILIGHALVRIIGKRRIKMLAPRRDAHLHGVDEIDRAPSPDTTLLVWGDVRHVEYAERRVQAASASERGLVLGFGAVAFLQRL